MAKLGMKARTVFLAVVWLGVVGVSVWIALARREEYGLYAYIVPGMALAMLTIFVIAFLPRKLQRKHAPEFLGDMATLALIGFAIAVLIFTLWTHRGSYFGTAVLALFLLSFLRILRDYIRHLRKKK